MDGMEWVRETWLDTLALTEDWMNSSEYREDMAMIEQQAERTLEEVQQLASQRGCIVLEVQTKEGKCVILFDDWFIDGKITRYEANHYGYADACQWLEQFVGREELVSSSEGTCETCGGLGEVREYPTGLFSLPAWKWVPCPECGGVEPEQDKPHPDECLCDECWSFRFAVCGYDD